MKRITSIIVLCGALFASSASATLLGDDITISYLDSLAVADFQGFTVGLNDPAMIGPWLLEVDENGFSFEWPFPDQQFYSYMYFDIYDLDWAGEASLEDAYLTSVSFSAASTYIFVADTYVTVAFEDLWLDSFASGTVVNDSFRVEVVSSRTVVPEPSTLFLLALGLFGFARRRRL